MPSKIVFSSDVDIQYTGSGIDPDLDSLSYAEVHVWLDGI